MVKRVLYSALAFVIIFSQPALAGHRQDFDRFNSPDSVVGEIRHISRNTLEIFDEDLKELRRFTYLRGLERFQVGERVRVFFEARSTVVSVIKKMTVLDYRTNGQNLGYIFRK